MNRKGYISVIDVGTKKICALIAEISPAPQESYYDEVDILGVGFHSSEGLKKGIVVDLEKSSKSIRSAVEEAEKMAGVEIESAFVGIAGSHIESVNKRSSVEVSGRDEEIKSRDIERVIEKAKEGAVDEKERIIHTLPGEYIVDGTSGIKHPQGMSGFQLEVDAHIVKGSVGSIKNLIKSVNQAGVEIEELVLDQLASSKAVLNGDERNLGVALADIGGGTTDFIAFIGDKIGYTSVLPVGGDHVSNDISVGLKISDSEAEKIKIQHGSVNVDEIEEDSRIEVKSASGSETMQVSRRYLCQIIRYRMEELFDLIGKEIDNIGVENPVPAGLVLTGGASLLSGSSELASQVTDLPTRIGEPVWTEKISELTSGPIYGQNGDYSCGPIYSTSAGLIKYALEHTSAGRSRGSGTKKDSSKTVEKFFSRVKKFFGGFFK